MVKFAVVALLGVLPGWAQRPHPNDARDYANYLAPFVSSPPSVVDRMLEVADLRPGQVLFDLGSGDGRVLITAVQRYKVKGVGVEISASLCKATEDRIKALKLSDRVRVIHDDMMNVDLSPADVVIIYLETKSNEILRPKLEKSLRPGARVISHDFAVSGWKANRTEQLDAFRRPHTIYIYDMPPKVK
jgi:protein-L-isoaspartate O-methyltransferase